MDMNFKTLKLLLILTLLCGCTIFHNHTGGPTGYNIEPGSKSFVVIDGGITFTPGLAIKKRRGVINEVKNQYFMILSRVLQKELRLKSITDTTLTADERFKLAKKDPAIIANLSKKYNTSIVLILKDCFSGFSKSNTKKVWAPGGKSYSEIAEYTVFFDTDWIILQGNTVNEKTVTASKLQSTKSRSTISLSPRVNYNTNKSEIQDVAEQNAYNVAQLFKY